MSRSICTRWTGVAFLPLLGLIVLAGCMEPGPGPETKAPETPKADQPADASKLNEAKPEEPGHGEMAPAEKPEEAKPGESQAAEPKPEAKPEEPKPEMKPEEAKPEAKPEAGEAAEAKPRSKPELLVTLPESCNTPDGMTLLADNSVIVSVPNFNDQTAPPLLGRITPDNQWEEFLKLPPHPDTGRIGPMGIRVASDGNLYLADNQLFHGKGGKSLFGKSRLLRIVLKDGKPTEVVPVATGMNVANGIAVRGDYVYCTETILKPESKPLVSGIYRFKLDETDVKMKQPLEEDPHLIATFESSGKIGFGADGTCFDKEGNLYVNCFEDAWIRKLKLDADGKVVSNEILVQGGPLKSTDGMDYDPATDKLYVADLLGNAVRSVSMDGKVETLAQSPDNDGQDGQLEAPCEALVRGKTIVVANMDFVVPGASVNTKAEPPHAISVVKLP